MAKEDLGGRIERKEEHMEHLKIIFVFFGEVKCGPKKKEVKVGMETRRWTKLEMQVSSGRTSGRRLGNVRCWCGW